MEMTIINVKTIIYISNFVKFQLVLRHKNIFKIRTIKDLFDVEPFTKPHFVSKECKNGEGIEMIQGFS